MQEKFSLKDHLFNEGKVRYLAGLLGAAWTDFDSKAFVQDVMREMPNLELKDRIRHIARVLAEHLPDDYESATSIVVWSLPPPLDPTKTDDDFGDFIFAPFGEFVATVGCTKDRLDMSLQTLRQLTMRFSMEDAIRSFLREFPNETMMSLSQWVSDDNYHVRRLVSEGTRPLLPWSGRVPQTAEETLPLLHALHADNTRYVTRSVANHLNDIAKKNPDLVIEILRRWQSEGKQNEKELTWMTKHALRTLIKNGHKDTLALLGYTDTAFVLDSFSVSPETVQGGEVVSLTVALTASADTNLLIDYVIHFVKKNGSTTPKVFKWKIVSLKHGESLHLTKNHRLKMDATTFTLYPGTHRVELQVNGKIEAGSDFVLEV
jgi:3-methyladenine DNA glycosylase AlkC